jgi:hypothetical protein
MTSKNPTLPLLRRAALLLLILGVLPASGQSRDSREEKSAAPDTLFNCSWSSPAVYPIPVLDNAVTSVGGQLYSFGGVSSSVVVANAYRYDAMGWTAIAPLPIALEYPAAVTDGTNIYIMGGADSGGNSSTAVFRYNVATSTYTPLAPLPTATWNHAAVYLNGKIYKFGGTAGTVSTTAHEIYDIASNTWSAGTVYPLAISFIGAVTDGTFIYAAGGIQSVGSVASAKTYRYDPATNIWDDAAIADLPATRWGAAAGMYTDFVLAGGYVAGSLTANISNTAIAWDAPSNSWLTVPAMPAERARMTGAVLNDAFHVVGGRSLAQSGFVGENSNYKLLCINTPTNVMANGGSSIVAAGGNGTLDPGESVTVALGARNVGGPGTVCTSNALTGTLQVSGGVTAPGAPQNFGIVCSGGPSTYRNFSFTVDPNLPCGSVVTATMSLMDGATNLGTLTYTFVTGNLATVATENFDGVRAPALPAGWSTTFSGSGTAAVTTTTFADTAPNSVFLSEAASVGLSEVTSPVLPIPAGGVSRLVFRNQFNTEANFDGLVLEISIAGGAFQDILAAGGSFASGGYNSTLSTGFSNPLPGRMAWTGLSGGTAAAPTFITTVVNLPASAAGQNIQLMWRQGSDSSVVPATNPGSRIDSLTILQPLCGTTTPVMTSAVSRKTHGGSGPFHVSLPLGPMAGPIGIEPRSGPVAGAHQIVVTFANPVSLQGVAVSTGAGSATYSVAGAVVTIDLTGVTNAQRLGLTLGSVSDGSNLGSLMIPVGFLAGDVNGNGSVTASDVAVTKSAAGSTADGTNFRADVNTSGGINAADVGQVKSATGGLLPP